MEGTITLRTRRPVPSRWGRGLAWVSLPWALLVLLSVNAVLGQVGFPPSEQPLVFRVLLLVVALAPGFIYVGGPWLARHRSMRWLLADPQPEAKLDPEGMSLVLPSRPLLRVVWSEIASLAPSNDLRRSNSLFGAQGEVLAKIPSDLVAEGRHGPRSLAEAVVAIRPDRYVITPPGMHSLTPGFDLRQPGVSVDARFDPQRSRRIAAIVVTFVVGIGVLATIVWISSSL